LIRCSHSLEEASGSFLHVQSAPREQPLLSVFFATIKPIPKSRKEAKKVRTLKK